MLQILKDVYKDAAIAPYLGFKGGTVCWFFYDLPRYSVDLDFDMLDGMKKKIVFKKISQIAEQYGRLKDAWEKRNTLFFLLLYGQTEQNIKIEISVRDLKNDFEVLNYLGLPMYVMKKPDIFANKLAALCIRGKTAARDVFDIHFFFSQGWDINEKIIEYWTGKNLNEYLKDCVRTIEKIPNNKILQGLGQLVDGKQKTWIRNNLKTETVLFMKAIVN